MNVGSCQLAVLLSALQSGGGWRCRRGGHRTFPRAPGRVVHRWRHRSGMGMEDLLATGSSRD